MCITARVIIARSIHTIHTCKFWLAWTLRRKDINPAFSLLKHLKLTKRKQFRTFSGYNIRTRLILSLYGDYRLAFLAERFGLSAEPYVSGRLLTSSAL